MPPENPTPDTRNTPKPGIAPAKPVGTTLGGSLGVAKPGQPSAPKTPVPAKPGTPPPDPASIPRENPRILVRAGILVGAALFTFFGLGYLSVVGDMLGHYIVHEVGWENIRVKATPVPAPPSRLPAIYTNPKDAPPPALTVPNFQQQTPAAVIPGPTPAPTAVPRMTVPPNGPIGAGGG